MKQQPSNEGILPERIGYLIACFIRGTLTEPEHDELDCWVEQSDDNMRLFEELTDEENIEKGLLFYKQIQENKNRKAKVLARIKKGIRLHEENTPWKQLGPYVVAASLILVIGSYYILKSTKNQSGAPPIAIQKVINEIPPGESKAVLTLNDGTTLFLDNERNGALSVQGNAQVVKLDSTLSYQEKQEVGIFQQVVYNTLTTPRGGQYQVTLFDGTKVWLNSASSLRYPTSFTGKDRVVELKGEGYFEVSKNPAQPFLVKTGETIIQVLGTHFNINAYRDESVIRTTLLEGSVKITSKGESKVLSPGQQAQTGEQPISIQTVDTQQTIAWKNGYFLFRNSKIESMLGQISRWYDIDIDYKGGVTGHFNLPISRKEPLSRLIKLLEGTGGIHFKLEEKKLVVLP